VTTPVRVLVVGGTSAIAHAVCRRYAARHARLYLVARNRAPVEANADDLRVRGAGEVVTDIVDANDVVRDPAIVARAFAAFGGFDIALVAFAVLPDQARAQRSIDEALECFDTNARSVIAWLTLLANAFEQQGSGVLGVISSPAGERGRASNYVYGASKAAVSVFAAGLRHRFAHTAVRVVTITPGFVDTPMNAHLPKGPLWATPERVAVDIERALQAGPGVVYTPWFWRWIMLVIRLMPERLFVRTRL